MGVRLGMSGLVALVVLALPGPAPCAAPESANGDAVAPGRTELNAIDQQFVRTASLRGLAEVRLGKLAAAKGESVEVKQFGQRMVDDHSRANDQLMQLAGIKGITIPAQLPREHRAKVDRLSRLAGAAFDRAYIQEMVRGHSDAIAIFERQIKGGQDQDIKNFAASTLSLLRDHLQEARKIHDKITGDRAAVR